MKREFPISIEFIFSIFALIFSFFVTHALYLALIRPKAEAFLAGQREGTIPPEETSFLVVIKDYEQETCIILFLWAIFMIFYKMFNSMRERKLLSRDIISVTEGMRIKQDDARDLRREVQALSGSLQRMLVPRSMMAALHRFSSSPNVQDTADAAHNICAAESDRLDSELSMIRYIAWAIPSIGFIGTVRGIGVGLARADTAMANNELWRVTGPLGVAFNSTLAALILSIILMFFLHQLQLMQERLGLDAENYVNDTLIRHLYVDNGK